jgi:hypothetical protein
MDGTAFARYDAYPSQNGTKRKGWNARVFPELGVDWLCHPPAGHSRPRPIGDICRLR